MPLTANVVITPTVPVPLVMIEHYGKISFNNNFLLAANREHTLVISVQPDGSFQTRAYPGPIGGYEQFTGDTIIAVKPDNTYFFYGNIDISSL